MQLEHTDSMLYNWSGVPVEAVEPRGEGPREDAEARAPLLQVHGLHRHLRPVQALREPRLHRSLGGRQEGRQGQAGKYFHRFCQCSGSEIINYGSGCVSSNWKSGISDPDPSVK